MFGLLGMLGILVIHHIFSVLVLVQIPGILIRYGQLCIWLLGMFWYAWYSWSSWYS